MVLCCLNVYLHFIVMSSFCRLNYDGMSNGCRAKKKKKIGISMEISRIHKQIGKKCLFYANAKLLLPKPLNVYA